MMSALILCIRCCSPLTRALLMASHGGCPPPLPQLVFGPAASHQLVDESSLQVRMTDRRGWGLFTTKGIKLNHGFELLGEVVTHAEGRARQRAALVRNECTVILGAQLWDHQQVYVVDTSVYGNGL
jgi:hypothetical protein